MSATSSPRCCPICNSEVTMVARLFLLAACLLGSTDALVVGGRGLSTVRQAATPLAPFTIMKSQEDKEFEEVRRPRPSPPSHPPLHRHAHHRPTLLHTSHCASSRTLTLTHVARLPLTVGEEKEDRGRRRPGRGLRSGSRGGEQDLRRWRCACAAAPPARAPSSRRNPLSAAHARFAALCAECGVRCSLRCSELCVCAASFVCLAGLITVLVPTIAGIWAYNEGYLTPQ